MKYVPHPGQPHEFERTDDGKLQPCSLCWLDDDVCMSCLRSDMPLIEQASGAYSLCARCETIARQECGEPDANGWGEP